MESSNKSAKSPHLLLMKRILDIIAGLMALLFLFAPLLIIAVLVRLKLGKPIIFRQPRPGRDGKNYFLVKFRTMKEGRDEKGNVLPDKLRLTKFGSALRRWSLDELPELWNVIRGDMSLVGPRPLLIEYLGRYNSRAGPAA